MVAEIGLAFDHGGHHHEIVTVDDDGVVAAIGQARLRLPYGQVVTVAGRRSRLVRCPPPPDVVDRVRQELRAWRSARATAEGKPPFVFLHDRTIEELALRVPVTTAALAGVTGIGPAKLEAYGDELLALIAAAASG